MSDTDTDIDTINQHDPAYYAGRFLTLIEIGARQLESYDYEHMLIEMERMAQERLALMAERVDADAALLHDVTEIVKANGGIFEVDRPGNWTVCIKGSPLTIHATPDWHEPGFLTIQVDREDGSQVSVDERPFPVRTADAWWALVGPYVEVAKTRVAR